MGHRDGYSNVTVGREGEQKYGGCGENYSTLVRGVSEYRIRLVPAQDGPLSYTRSHLSALQNCALFFSTNFQFIFIFKECITQFNH